MTHRHRHRPTRPGPAPAGVGLALFALLAALPAQAQESTTRGLSLGFGIQAASLSIEGGDEQGGGGVGIRVGYGFNRIVTAFLRIDGSEIDVRDEDSEIQGDWRLAHAEIGARFHFANSLRRWVPYLEAAVGARGVQVENPRVEGERVDQVDFNGSAFSLGGGLGIHFTRTLAADVGVVFSNGEFNEIDVGAVAVQNLDLDASSFRFNLGLAWWP